MKETALNWRKIMRKVYTGLGLGAAALVFQACYGMGIVNDLTIAGVVKSEKTGAPIKGIQVLGGNASSEDITDSTGQFWLSVPGELDEYILTFNDIDGAVNGAYESKTETVDMSGDITSLEIKLSDDAGAE